MQYAIVDLIFLSAKINKQVLTDQMWRQKFNSEL